METVKNFYMQHKKIIKIIATIMYMVVFAVISLTIGSHHEHWADEAQSWLIARDNNIQEIFEAIRYEGTPALWQLLLKVCIMCGLQYNNLCYLTTILTLIGIVFLFKNKNVPLMFKILLPYTYYIFFQYTVVARSYTLIFPLLMAIAYIYPKKEEKLLQYGVLLILLMNVSSHTFFFASGLWLGFFIETLRKLWNGEKFSVKKIIFFTITALSFFAVIYYVFPASDSTTEIDFSATTLTVFLSRISASMFTSVSDLGVSLIFCLIIVVLLISLTNKNTVLKNIFLLLPNILFIGLGIGCVWHVGLIFLFILTVAIINNKLNNKIVFVILLISVVIQIYWNVICCQNDYNNLYASGEAVAEYLEEIGYEGKKIMASHFWVVQVNPYFDENIYDNYVTSYYNYKNTETVKSFATTLAKSDLDADIYIIPEYYSFVNTLDEEYKVYSETAKNLKILVQLLEESENYEEKYFESYLYSKDKLDQSTGLYVFVKKVEE